MKIYKFGADWCAPCKVLAATLEDLHLPYTNVNVDEDEDLVDQYKIRNIPVLIFADDEGNVLKRLVGAVSKDTILDTYNSLQS